MKPEGMTNEQLIEAIRDYRFALVDEIKELLRRLNESDALRKENEELATALKQAGDKLSMVAPLCDESLDSSAALYARELRIDSTKQKEASHE